MLANAWMGITTKKIAGGSIDYETRLTALIGKGKIVIEISYQTLFPTESDITHRLKHPYGVARSPQRCRVGDRLQIS